MALIIFTGLAETLLPIENNYEPVVSIVNKLQQNNIPLITVTDNTRAEVEVLSKKIGLNAPFVVEGGSGIFIPQDNCSFGVAAIEAINGYYLHQLGCSYTEARAALKAVQEEISKILRGFGDLDQENIQTIMKVSPVAAKRAKSREFSEYFLTPSRWEIEKLQAVAEEYGFKIVSRGKLSLIMGNGADRGKAITWLKENYQIPEAEKVITVGLGATKQDLPLLEAVDLPMIIPTDRGVDPIFASKKWQTSSATGFIGWIEAIAKFGENDLISEQK